MAGGLSSSGFLVNYLDIAPEHASVLMGIGNSIGTIAGIMSPTITGQIVKNKVQFFLFFLFFSLYPQKSFYNV